MDRENTEFSVSSFEYVLYASNSVNSCAQPQCDPSPEEKIRPRQCRGSIKLEMED